jgi:hypothetical protein
MHTASRTASWERALACYEAPNKKKYCTVPLSRRLEARRMATEQKGAFFADFKNILYIPIRAASAGGVNGRLRMDRRSVTARDAMQSCWP